MVHHFFQFYLDDVTNNKRRKNVSGLTVFMGMVLNSLLEINF